MAEPTPALLQLDPLDSTLLRELFEALPHDIAVLTPSGVLRFTNHSWTVSPADPMVHCSLGQNLLDHFSAVRDQHRPIAEHLRDGVGRVLHGRSPRFELQYEVRVGESSRWFLVAAATLPDGGAVITHSDTTVHHTVQDVLTEMAFHDLLTGLPNRALVLDRIRMALVRAQRNALFPAVMFIDLDKFKLVNDQYGHAMGDQVLIEAANRLSSAVREGDTCGRWGGDEFVLVLDLIDPATIDGLIRRAQDAFAEPFVIDGATIELGLSIGVVVSQPTDRIEHLIRCADEAMYDAKRSGSGVRVVDSRHPTLGDDEVLHLS